LSRPKPRTTPPSIPRPSEEKCLLRSLSNAVAPCSRVPARTGRPTFLSLQTFRNDSAVHEDTPPARYAAASTAIKSGDQTYMESEVPAPAPPRPCRWPVPPMRGPRPQRPAALPLAGGACVIDPAVLRGERVQVIPSDAAAALPMARAADARPTPAEARGAAVDQSCGCLRRARVRNSAEIKSFSK
jgi:hypothetical protein